MTETTFVNDDDLVRSMEAHERSNDELAILFGRETVEQASQVDIADLNLNEEIVSCISTGIRSLKELRNNPVAQADFTNGLEPGARLLLCMWIMEMGLLEKIQKCSSRDIR